jgi:hypothetical protein
MGGSDCTPPARRATIAKAWRERVVTWRDFEEGLEMRGRSSKSAVRSWSGALLCIVLASVAAAARAAPFMTNESQVTPRQDMFDPEYNLKRAKITWVDAIGRLWVANVDRTTGLLKPPNGMGVLVDPDALTASDQMMVGNGPEWLLGSGPDRIVYTKFVAGLPHDRGNARLAVAEQGTNGAWTYRFLDDRNRLRPYASQDPRDTAPRISYVDAAGNAYWRVVDDPASEVLVAAMPPSRVLPMRFVGGLRATVFVASIGGADEVVRYWLDTGVVEQLTFDGGHGKTTPFMWRAPEFDDDVLMLPVKEATELWVYRQLDKSSPVWTVVFRASAPPGTKIISQEPFVLGGKSYVFMAVMQQPDLNSSSIYISNIDAAQPLFRQITPDDPVRKRSDPEVFVTGDGQAYIYFARVNMGSGPPCPCYEGIWRSNTGLPPAPAH